MSIFLQVANSQPTGSENVPVKVSGVKKRSREESNIGDGSETSDIRPTKVLRESGRPASSETRRQASRESRYRSSVFTSGARALSHSFLRNQIRIIELLSNLMKAPKLSSEQLLVCQTLAMLYVPIESIILDSFAITGTVPNCNQASRENTEVANLYKQTVERNPGTMAYIYLVASQTVTISSPAPNTENAAYLESPTSSAHSSPETSPSNYVVPSAAIQPQHAQNTAPEFQDKDGAYSPAEDDSSVFGNSFHSFLAHGDQSQPEITPTTNTNTQNTTSELDIEIPDLQGIFPPEVNYTDIVSTAETTNITTSKQEEPDDSCSSLIDKMEQ